jgi:excisionase family DNA binding protein
VIARRAVLLLLRREPLSNDLHAHNDGRMTESLLTAKEVAELLGVPTSWVYEQSRCGRIPTVTLGRYRRYRREAIEEWLAQLESSPRGARAYAGSTR